MHKKVKKIIENVNILSSQIARLVAPGDEDKTEKIRFTRLDKQKF